MPSLNGWMLRLGTWPAARRFEAATRRPGESQLHCLRSIVERNRETEYGREHGFAQVRSLEDWRQRVPVVEYEEIRPLVDRMARGEKKVLTAEDPVMFAQTSGTTGDPKLIPVTPTCLHGVNSDQMRTWLHHAGREHPAIFEGRILTLVSPAVEGRTECGLPFGSTSGHIYRHLPRMLQRLYAIPYGVFALEDYETKYYLLVRTALEQDVTFFCSANPSSILKICEVADECADDLIRDVRDGSINADRLKLSGEEEGVVRELKTRFKKDAKRAAALEQARERRSGRLLPADYWPRIALVGCWKGGTVGGNVAKLAEWFDPDGQRAMPVRDWGYLASEMRGSVPLTDEGCGGALTVGSNVFEFVAAKEVEEAPDDWRSWSFLDVSGVRRDQEYYVFVTTTGGLYRYDMNDVIEVTGFHHATPIIEFRRKGRGMTSITGEKVSVNQVIEAFEGAAKKVGVEVDHFKAEADEAASRYVFKVEFKDGLADGAKQALLTEVESRLGELNSEYRSKRKSLRLQPPVLLLMRHGWYEQGQSGALRDFQRKTVKLSAADDADHEFVEEQVTLDSAR